MLSLPLIVMALLALGTYWMVRNAPPPPVAEQPKPLGHSPDYYMHKFSLKTYEASGALRTEVTGDVARHYPDTLQLEIEGVQIRAFDKAGRVTIASAQRGLTNQDSSEVQLIGNARVVREADASARPKPLVRMEYRGEFLHAFIETERVISHKPVELLRGKDRMTADSLVFDNIDQMLDLKGHVRATLHPQSE